MKKILVTGSSGLVGSALKKIACERGISDDFIFVSSRDADLTNYQDTERMFQKYQPTHVIHLAACVGGLFKNMKYKVDMLEKNLLINFNVVRCSHQLGVKKLISCLSTCIFPDQTAYPINEGILHNGPPHFSNDAYAYAKRMLEIQSKAYREQYGDNFICVIPTNIYGPHDNFNLEDGHVIPALIHRCYLAKQAGESFRVLGTGKPLRQFIYSEDLAELFLEVLFNYKGSDSLILSVSESDEVSIREVATKIAKAYNYEEMIEFTENSSQDGQYKKTADNTKLMKFLPDLTFTPISEGIQRSVEWFTKNYSSARK